LIDGVVIQPTPYAKKAAITKYGNNQNFRDLVQDKVDELSYGLADKVDKFIAAAVGAATETTSTVAGATTIYGGSATADSDLTNADVLTTELVNRAETILSDKYAYYHTGGVFTKSSGVKNPWSNEPTDPYVLVIGPKQRKAFRDSSEFMNVSQYGSDVVISSGEIGSYLGIRIIVTNNALRVAAAGTAFDGGSAPSVDIARCVLMKGRKAYTFVWGQSPTFYPWFNEQRVQEGVTLYAEWSGAVVHADAIVKIDVADSLVVA
jgi:N4-gp56 family major capsid protein